MPRDLVYFVSWLDPEGNPYIQPGAPCPKAATILQSQVDEFKNGLVQRGVAEESIKSITVSPRHTDKPCSDCFGSGLVTWDADGIFDTDWLTNCYRCNGSGMNVK